MDQTLIFHNQQLEMLQQIIIRNDEIQLETIQFALIYQHSYIRLREHT